MLRVAVDCMGGDYAPQEIVLGSVRAAEAFDLDLFLVGDPEKIEKELKKTGTPIGAKAEIVAARETIGMDESPVQAIRQKREASIVVASQLVSEGEAAAVISAGNTGASMAAGILIIGRIQDVERPAISTFIPTLKKPAIFLDVGANVDCKPQHLVQFAHMGSLYAEVALNRPNPRVGLLNIGEESEKGNDLAQKTHRILEKKKLNFIGNIEGDDIFTGGIDVIVCDGFVGNTVLKAAEGLVDTVLSLIRESCQHNLRTRVGAWLMSETFQDVKKQIDYAEYGGAPLLGIDGISIIAHGSSNARAFRNACLRAREAYASQLTENIKSRTGW